MAVALRSVGVSPGADSDTCVIDKPAGLSVGDLMIAHVSVHRGNSTPSVVETLLGWTLIRQDADDDGSHGIRSALFWKIADSGDTPESDFTFDLAAARANIGAISAWTGHDPVTPINANNGQYQDSSTVTSPAITPSVASCMICLFCAASDNNTFSSYAIATSNPGSWNEAYDINSAAGYDSCAAMANAIRPETTSTGNGTASASGRDPNIGQLVAIAPAGAAGWTTIAKVNGVGQADLAKINGVAKTDIAKINGVAV